MSETHDPRILFAAERTLMAWQRTSIALIAFGFVIERSGFLLRLLGGAELVQGSLLLTIGVGLVFIGAGIFVALYSTRAYATVLESIRPIDFPPGYGARWGMGINVLIAVLGALLGVGLLWAH